MSIMSPAATTLYPPRRAARAMKPEDLWAIPRVGNPAVSSDGSRIAVAVTTYDLEKNEGKSRIWLIEGDASPRALTSPESSSGEPAFSPDGSQLAFTRKDEKGKPQLFLMSFDGGEPRRVTGMPLGVFDPRWLPDGSGIVFGAKLIKGHLTPEATKNEIERREKDPVKAHVTEDRVYRYWDSWLTTGEVPHLFVLDLATEAVRDLTPDSVTWFDWMDLSGHYDISPDGKEVAYSGISVSEDGMLLVEDLFVVPLSGGTPRRITGDHAAGIHRPRYAPNGKTLLYGKQLDHFFYADRVRLTSYDRASGEHLALADDWDRSPSDWVFGADGTLFVVAEEAARLSLFRLKGGGAPEVVVRGGSVSGLAIGGDRLAFSLNNLASPAEVHACSVDGSGLRRITHFTDAATSAFGTGEVREMSFEGANGETVQMFVVLPVAYEEGKKYPLVQVIHGGPHGVSGDTFFFRWNAHAFAAPGYVISLVNFQGSTGWGQDFAKRIQGAWGDLPFGDVMKATDALVAAGCADENRMAAAGGSYGGYMAAWIEGHTDRFKCIVNHAGVYSLGGMYASDVTQGRAQSLGGEPWKDLEKVDRWDPSRAAKGFKTPMLVIHGERDYRVPITQGLECYGVLKAKGVPARLVYFPDENHWILKPKNSMFWYGEVMGWLGKYLAS